ncbi:MAG: hypothetical protein AB1805_03105 [Nitrospirota bacterium]
MMQRISRIYVGRFGSNTAWYEHHLFDLTDPDTQETTDTVFNLENGGGKTSLLSFIFSMFDPKQERWLQHLQKKELRFTDYFARDGRPSFLIMEWDMPARAADLFDYKLIIGQSVALKESTERGTDVDRCFFAFEATKDMGLEEIPAPGLTDTPVRSMTEFTQWMQQASKRAGDFHHTKTQDDWVKHLNYRLLDTELLRMQVDFNSSEGGMEKGFLTFNTEIDLLRRFLWLTLDQERSATVRDAVAQTADKLKSKPKYERRLEQLIRLQSVMVPFAETATQYETADAVHKETQRQAAGIAVALLKHREQRQRSMQEKTSYALTQDGIVKTSQDIAAQHQNDIIALRGLLYDRKVAAAAEKHGASKEALEKGAHRLRCVEGTEAMVHVEAARERVKELEALYESEREGLKPARQQAEIQGSLFSCALHSAEKAALQRKGQAEEAERIAKSLIAALKGQQSDTHKEIIALSTEEGQLIQFLETYQTQRDRLRQELLLQPDDADSSSALKRLRQQLKGLEEQLVNFHKEHQELDAKERTLRQGASEEALAAAHAHAEQEAHRTVLAAGEALRDALRQDSSLCTAADAEEVDPDSQVLLEALDRLLADTQREIADRNISLAQLKADRGSIIETGLAGRSADIDAVVRQLQGAGIRSARAANTYVAELRPSVEEARALVLSDPARFLGVNVAKGEWAKTRQRIGSLVFKLSAPVTIAVASVDDAPDTGDRIVLASQDDSAYNKEAARTVLAALDARIHDQEDQLAAYEKRRDLAIGAREKLVRYQSDYGTACLRKAEAEIERLQAEEQAAQNRGHELTILANSAQEEGKIIAAKTQSLPTQIESIKGSIRRIGDFQRDLETPSADKRDRLKEVQSLLDSKRKLLEDTDRQRNEADEQARHALEDCINYGKEAQSLAAERAQITYHDTEYPAEEQLRKKPRGIETLRITYADAEEALKTQERHRLGVLAEKLSTARNELTKATVSFNEEFADLDTAELEPFRALDFEGALRDQRIAVQRLYNAQQEAQTAFTVANTERTEFWKGKRKITSTQEMHEKTDEALVTTIEEISADITRFEDMATRAAQEAEKARHVANQDDRIAKELETLHAALKATIPFDSVVSEHLSLSDDVSIAVQNIISEFRRQENSLNTLREKALEAFRHLTRVASAKEFSDVEPELSRDIIDSDFEPACSDRVRIASLVEDRIKATQDTLEGMKPDFENCVGELYNLTYEGIGLLNRACTMTMPFSTPYVGGKHILKMKASFVGISVEVRKEAIRHYLNTLIDSNVIPAKGADIVAQCLVLVSGRKELGLQVLIMEQNEAYQYQFIAALKDSRGQGTVIAMFLYLLISQLRADTQARVKRGGGGPLILDNPFASVQTRSLLDAQRLLAKEIGVQLIFFTALKDPNILSAFRRLNRLRKTGVNSVTNRSHVEMVSGVFEDLAGQQAEEA